MGSGVIAKAIAWVVHSVQRKEVQVLPVSQWERLQYTKLLFAKYSKAAKPALKEKQVAAFRLCLQAA